MLSVYVNVRNDAVISHVTISGNTGGLFTYSQNGRPTVSHSIVSNNSFTQDYMFGLDFAGVADSRFNIIGSVFEAPLFEGEPIDIEESTIFTDDPQLAPLAQNGGRTLSMLPLADSPAVNAGDPAFMVPPLYDQRGPGFPRVANGRINIGAVEGWSGLIDRIFHSGFSEPQ